MHYFSVTYRTTPRAYRLHSYSWAFYVRKHPLVFWREFWRERRALWHPAHSAMLVSAATDVAFWDPGRSDEPIHLSTEHTSPVTSLRWTSNDRVLASSAHDGAIHLTESDGRLFDTLRPSVPNEPAAVLPVLSLSWSPGSRYLAAVIPTPPLTQPSTLPTRTQ
jgi:WD40 repeat protein